MSALVRLPVEGEDGAFVAGQDAVSQRFITDAWGVRCQEFSLSGDEKYHFSTCFSG